MTTFGKTAVLLVTIAIVAQVARPVPSFAVPTVSLLASEDSWEVQAVSSADSADTECKELESVYFAPVRPGAQEGTIRRLQNVPLVSIDHAESRNLLGMDTSSDSAVIDLIARKISEFELRRNSWSVADQLQVNELVALSQNPAISGLKPYLVRAVGPDLESTDFVVGVCGDMLLVQGWINPSPYQRSVRRLPLVVFLDQAPAKVVVERYFPSAYKY